MMKIVYLLGDYTKPGGIERVIAKKANYMIKAGLEIFIVSLNNSEKEPFFQFDSRIKFFTLGIKDSPKNKAVFLEKISELLNEIKPDISITTDLGINQYLYEVKDNSKKIFEYHFSKYKGKTKFAALSKYPMGKIIQNVYSRNLTQIAKSYDKFVVLTEEDKQQWRGIGNIEVIPNPLSFIPREYSNQQIKRVISVGRLSSQKGFNTLIEIWSKVSPKYPDWQLTIFGSGRKQSELQKQIKDLGLEKTLEIKPSSKEIENELRNSSVYAMTSRYEGLPLVLMEALSCGLPAVAFACKCGPRDLINENEDGFLISPGNKNNFIEKLSLLISDLDLRQKMGHAAQKNILRYTEDKIMPKWFELFNKLLQ